MNMKNQRLNELIGSPSYPSPLDRLRTGKRERAAQFGLTPKNEESFEGNQSFPRAQLHTKANNCDFSPLSKILNAGNAPNSISFLPMLKKNFKKLHNTTYDTNTKSDQQSAAVTAATSTSSIGTSFNNTFDVSFGFDKSWQFYNYFANSDALSTTVQNVTKNPNKALVTIHGRNSEILTANDIACELFGYCEDVLIGMKLKDLLDVNSHHKHDVIMESHLDDTGNLVLCSGKLLEAIDSNGIVIPISVYMQKLTSHEDHEPKCLCIIEPVQRFSGNFSINVKGQIRSFDDTFVGIFGYVNQRDTVFGMDINEFIPKLKLPMCTITNDTRKQTLTGRTLNGINVPLTVRIVSKQLFNNEEIVFNCVASFYTNISGLITVRLSDGLINSYNPIFTRILFGYDDESLKNKSITTLIPDFYEVKEQANNESRTNEDEDDEVINKNLNRMLYDDDFTPEVESNKKFKPNEDEKSFNSKSIDSSNLSIKTSEFTFNTASNVTAASSSNIDVDIEDESSDDDDSTAKYCYTCGCELKYKRQTDHVLNFIVKSSNTPVEKCNSFVIKHDFSQVSSNDSSIQSPSSQSVSFLNNTSAFDDSKLAQNSLNISEYQDKYICDACIEKINAGKSILPLAETNKEHDNDESAATSTYENDDDTENDVSLIATDAEIDCQSTASKYEKIPVISITPALDESLAKKNFLKTKLNLLKGNSSTNNGPANPAAAVSNIAQITSTPAPNEDRMMSAINKNYFLREGTFCTKGKHSDGEHIQIIYQRKIIEVSKDKKLACIWICKDPEMDKSMMESTFNDQSQLRKSLLNDNSAAAPTTPIVNQYSFEYEDLSTLGRGASGFVQSAKRKQDSFEVVTKYIRKSKIHKDNWLNDDRYGQIPLEVSILCKLDHVNVIKVLEVFQDDDYIQMVMEKHGCGMDLFEFIDRQPSIDEQLASYIFRQLVSAVSYLHSNNIVHRDIKDENIVINEQFSIKLIDFGSAAYMQKGKKFATFCGTLDYCSPEVLLGNKYYGPELDCWTIGIALYTLVFAENPFFDADETIECILKPPFKVSKELMKLLFSILYPKPEMRATITDIETNEWVTQYVDMSKYKWEHVIKNTVFNGNNAGDCRFGESEVNDSDIDLTSSATAVSTTTANILKPRDNNEILDVKPVNKAYQKALANANIHSKSF